VASGVVLCGRCRKQKNRCSTFGMSRAMSVQKAPACQLEMTGGSDLGQCYSGKRTMSAMAIGLRL